MIIKVGTTELTSAAIVEDTGKGPPSDVRVVAEVAVQDSHPIGADRRLLFHRKNAAGTLSFTTRPRYSTLAKAAAGAWTLAKLRGTEGVLDVQAGSGGSSSPSDNAANGETAGTAGRKAIIRKVETRQTGVSVEAKYEIEF